MATIRISFIHGYGAALVILVASVSLVSALLFYFRVARFISLKNLTGLLLLRILALVALLLCLFQPVISLEQERKRRTALAFLLDISRSMSVNDLPQLPNRLEQAKNALLTNPSLKQLEKEFHISYFAFAHSLRKLDRPAELKALKAEGHETKIAAAVLGAVKQSAPEGLSGIVLLSDGIDNSGRSPAQVLEGLGIPIHTIGVGTKLEAGGQFKDIVLEDVEVKPLLTVGNLAEVSLFIEALGLAGRVVSVSLKDDAGQEVASQKLTLDGLKGAQKLSLKFTPEKVGRYVYQAGIPVDSDEQIPENNERLVAINVVDPKIKVLYMEGTIRAEYKFLLRTLQVDPNVQLLALLKVQQNRFTKQGDIADVKLTGLPRSKEELKQFDVVIVGDLDVTHFSLPVLVGLKEMVDEGGGFMMLGGYSSFGAGGYGGTPVEDALPVYCGGRNTEQEKEPFALTLTAEGASHPILSGCESFFPTLTTPAEQPTPKLLGCVRLAGIKPGAIVLAVNPLRKLGDDYLPVLTIQQFGKGRSAAFVADTTWRWYSRLRGLGLESPYVKFWGQTIRWLASRSLKEMLTGPGIQVFTDKAYYQPGESVSIRANVRGERGRIAPESKATVNISGPGGFVKELTLSQHARLRDQHSGEFMPPSSGQYRLEAAASEAGKLLGKEEIKFLVATPVKEYDQLDLNEELLQKLAAQAGGRYYPLVSIAHLARSLQAKQQVRRIYKEKELAHAPSLFVVFIALISIEWLLRKRWQLT